MQTCDQLCWIVSYLIVNIRSSFKENYQSTLRLGVWPPFQRGAFYSDLNCTRIAIIPDKGCSSTNNNWHPWYSRVAKCDKCDIKHRLINQLFIDSCRMNMKHSLLLKIHQINMHALLYSLLFVVDKDLLEWFTFTYCDLDGVVSFALIPHLLISN